MSRLHDRMLRRRAEEAPADPMHAIGNLADAMLVLAVGIMLALIINWNVDISAKRAEQPAAPVPFDQSDLTEAPDGAQVLEGGDLQEMGTVCLTADLDMGGVYNAAAGTWSGPNWTPIGGKYPMKPDEVACDCLTLDTRFNGVLDGQGHTISNLYCDRYAAKGFPYSMAVGLVGFLGGTSGNDHGGLAEFTDGWQPAASAGTTRARTRCKTAIISLAATMTRAPAAITRA